MRGGVMGIMRRCGALRCEAWRCRGVRCGAGQGSSRDGAVWAAHPDAATLNLLRRIRDGETSVQAATAATMEELGPDPYYDAVMVAYPPEE